MAPLKLRELLATTKALGDENRLRIPCALEHRELCLCQIVKLLRLATSTVSRHMSILQQARLVACRKQGRWVFFRLARSEANRAARDALAMVTRALRGDRLVRADAKRLEDILKMDPELLCRKQTTCRS